MSRAAPFVPVDVLVLAGSRGPGDPVAAARGTSCKATAPVAGVPMIERVLNTLRACPEVGRIAVALDAEVPVTAEAPRLAAWLAAGTVTRLDPGPGPSATVAAAFAARDESRPLLVATADHPLLTPALVEAFLAGARLSGADAVAAVAPTKLLEAAYPGARRTRLRFRDGGFGGCNLFALMGPGAAAALDFWQTLEGQRKRPWRMAAAIGAGTLVAYAVRRLTLDAAVARLGRRVGARLAAVRLNVAEAGKDVDSLDDLELVESILMTREGSSGSPQA